MPGDGATSNEDPASSCLPRHRCRRASSFVAHTAPPSAAVRPTPSAVRTDSSCAARLAVSGAKPSAGERGGAKPSAGERGGAKPSAGERSAGEIESLPRPRKARRCDKRPALGSAVVHGPYTNKVCMDMRAGMGMDMRTDMRVGMHVDMHMDMRVGIRMDMCMGIHVDM